MVRVHDKYRGVRTMVDTFLKKDKSGGGGGWYQDFRADTCRCTRQWQHLTSLNHATSVFNI